MDFFDRYFGWFIAIGIGLVIALAVASLVASERAHDAFMAACKKDHKEYECTAAWRAGSTTVLPIFIPTR